MFTFICGMERTFIRTMQRGVSRALLYADDVMFAANIREGLQCQVKHWHDHLHQFCLLLNILKTKYLELISPLAQFK